MRQFEENWRQVHACRSTDRRGARHAAPAPSLDAPKITLLAQCFALGDDYVRDHVRDFWKWVWANCRTGNTSQLAFLEDRIFCDGFEAYWAASRRCAVGVHNKRPARRA